MIDVFDFVLRFMWTCTRLRHRLHWEWAALLGRKHSWRFDGGARWTGGWLTTPQLRERDGIVFDILASNKTPVAWDLAGGYQIEPDGSIPKVLEIHDNTMRECVRVYGQ